MTTHAYEVLKMTTANSVYRLEVSIENGNLYVQEHGIRVHLNEKFFLTHTSPTREFTNHFHVY